MSLILKNPFKKAFSSRKAKVDDEDFEYDIQRIRIMQGVSKRLYKGIRQCSEIELSLAKLNSKTAYELKGNSTITSIPLRMLVESFISCADGLQIHTRDLYSILDTTFYDPMRRFRDVYKHLEFHVKQREARLQEVERQQTKLNKRRSSSSVTPNKLELTQRKLSSRKNDYERVHDRLMNDMPKLYEGRISYFKPCLVAMMESQYLYHKNCSNNLSKMLTAFEKEHPSLSTTNRSVEDCFNDIRQLSIVGQSPAALSS